MRPTTILALATLGPALLTLGACSDDDSPTGPGGGGGGGTSTDLTIAVERLEVSEDGDSGSAGDFFISLSLVGSPDTDARLLGEVEPSLVQLNDGESQTLTLEAQGTDSVRDGYQVDATVSIYENDPDGPQVTATDTMRFQYHADDGCWKYGGDDPCLGYSGSITASVTRLRDTASATPCSADLYWRFSAE